MLAFVATFIGVGASAAPIPEEVLRSSLALLRGARGVSVRLVVINDEVVATGQKLQRSSDGLLKIRRPDRFRVDVSADRYSRSIVYDGKTLFVYDPDKKLYASVAAPPTIDATAAAVREKLGLDLPLSQLFADDPFAALNARTRTGTYVGLHRIDGIACHHLAFSQENLDWQIWIAAQDSPVPRKIAIDFKNRPGRPQYIALLSDWNLQAVLADSAFRFSPPPGAQKIEFLQSEGSSNEEP
jgi:hypothetical protein